MKIRKPHLTRLALLLFLLYPYSGALSGFLYRSDVVIALSLLFSVGLLLIAHLRGSGGLPLLHGQSMWLVFLLLVLVRNHELAHGDFAQVVSVVVGVCFMLLLPGLGRQWVGPAYRMLVFFSALHIGLGFFFWWNPAILRGVVLPHLTVSRTSKLLKHIGQGFMTGITAHYSHMGMILANAFLVICCKYLFRRPKGRVRIWGRALALASLVALFLTGKRAHLLFGVAALCATYELFYATQPLWKRVKRVISYVLIILAVLWLIRDTPVFAQMQKTLQRFQWGDSLDEITSDRWSQLWWPAVQVILRYPAFGVGWRGFRYEYSASFSSKSAVNDAHNVYLQLMAETGLIGFFCIGLILSLVFLQTYQLAKRNDIDERVKNQQALSFALQAFFLLYCLTGNPLYDKFTWYPYVLACAITYTNQLHLRQAGRDAPLRHIWRVSRHKSYGREAPI